MNSVNVFYGLFILATLLLLLVAYLMATKDKVSASYDDEQEPIDPREVYAGHFTGPEAKLVGSYRWDCRAHHCADKRCNRHGPECPECGNRGKHICPAND